ncbi:MAG: exosortase C-terminal domain/associated protein EpsI [Pyrinomonadaceae bacterium]
MTESIFSKTENFWKPLAVACAVAFVYAAVLMKLGVDWWTDENYSHGLIVPFVIGYIVWLEFDNLKSSIKKSSVWVGGVIILAAFLMLLAGTLGAELFTQRVSLVVMIAGIVIYFFGARILRKLVVPFALLLLAIPIPQIIFNKIAFPLQLWASQMAIWGIRLFEIPSVRKGNVIELLPQGATQIVALEVVEACSGIRSLMTLVTLALVLAYFTREKREHISDNFFSFLQKPARSKGAEGAKTHLLRACFRISDFDFWRAVILMLSAIPIAILTNAARVSATGILTYYYGRQIAEGFWHELSGWLVFLAALVLLMLVNFALKKVQGSRFKIQGSESANYQLPITNYQLPITNYQTVILIAALFFGGVFINWFQQRGELLTVHQPLQQIPVQLGNWRQTGSDTRFSAETESVLRASDYVMRDYVLPDGRGANLYVGFYDSQRGGATYHSPQNCLPGAGWEMKNPELVEIKTPSGKTFTANRYIVQNGDYREVLVYWYQGRGRATASEYRDKIYTVLDSIFRRRSDGAMARVMTPVGSDETKSLQAAIDLSAQIADNLAPFVPD